MQLDIAFRLEKILYKRTQLMEIADRLNRVKHFTSITLFGENGNEVQTSIKFDWKDEIGNKKAKRIMDILIEDINNEIGEVNKEIEAL